MGICVSTGRAVVNLSRHKSSSFLSQDAVVICVKIEYNAYTFIMVVEIYAARGLANAHRHTTRISLN